ncbi:MAG: hypothetical protein ABR964_11330 [Tepidisphaeraceae bacterium]|jgi:hypothetical protein
MRIYIGVSFVCLSLMLAGNARAAYGGSHYGARNGSWDLPYFLVSQDLRNHDGGNVTPPNNNNGDKNKHGDDGGVTLPPPCQPPADNNNPGCGDKGDKDGGCLGGGDKDDKGGKGGCDNGPPHCPHNPGGGGDVTVVPLPASSALGGVGLVIAGLYTWLRGRRTTTA